jgi:hypothetical protein
MKTSSCTQLWDLQRTEITGENRKTVAFVDMGHSEISSNRVIPIKKQQMLGKAFDRLVYRELIRPWRVILFLIQSSAILEAKLENSSWVVSSTQAYQTRLRPVVQ